MKEIALTQGKIALVDDEDYERLNQFKWCVQKHGRTYYAMRKFVTPHKTHKTQFIHQQIITVPPGMETDHIDGDGLNNQKSNLRAVTHWENMQNYHADDKTSKYSGVDFEKGVQRWRARYRGKFLGLFDTEDDAKIARDFYMMVCHV